MSDLTEEAGAILSASIRLSRYGSRVAGQMTLAHEGHGWIGVLESARWHLARCARTGPHSSANLLSCLRAVGAAVRTIRVIDLCPVGTQPARWVATWSAGWPRRRERVLTWAYWSECTEPAYLDAPRSSAARTTAIDGCPEVAELWRALHGRDPPRDLVDEPTGADVGGHSMWGAEQLVSPSFGGAL